MINGNGNGHAGNGHHHQGDFNNALNGGNGHDSTPPDFADQVQARRNGRYRPNGGAGAIPLYEIPLCTTVYEWLNREMAPPDWLMGEVFSTVSRVLLVGPTGIGKSNLAIALTLAMAEGRDFLHWRAGRPARVLYIDGEMNPQLFQQRIRDAFQRAARAGHFLHPNNPRFVCLSDLPVRPPPLNTPEGQKYFDGVINTYDPEFLFLDNVQCLLAGLMSDEEPWKQVMPWILSLTQRQIGQTWIHHTGWDETHGYGTSTRDWQFDASPLMERLSEDGDLEFRLKFLKARNRTPDNRADYAAQIIRLIDDEWTYAPDDAGKGTAAAKPAKPRGPSPVGAKFYDALLDALSQGGEIRQESAGRPSVTDQHWISELTRLGLVTAGDDQTAKQRRRSLLSKYRRELIAANWIACNGELCWAIREAT